MQRIQLKIAHKGLILVAVPLIFEIAFVLCLLQMLKAADQQATELAQSREVIACASELDKCLAFAAQALLTYKITQSDRLVKRYDEMAAQSARLCTRLAELAKAREGIRARVARINDICAKIILVTSNFRMPAQESIMLMNKAASVGQVERAYEALYEETQALTLEEEKVLAGGSNSQIRSRATIYALINAAVLFNVGLSLAMAVYFTRSITRRIGVVNENTQRLAQGDSLMAPVRGDDEITTLDSVFHRMARDLRDTEQRKQDFVSMITHDLRTPLTSMRTISVTLAEGAQSRQDQDDYQRVQVLERSLDRMINLVNDLLDMDRIEAGLLLLDFHRCSFNEVLETAVESVQHLAQQRKIKIEFNALEVEVEIDQKRILQILVNLMANAIKYSPRGATVSILSKSDEAWLDVSVIDLGRGVPEDQLDTIFDRFKQIEQADSSVRGGSGLGLAITKALVELHQGTVGVQSTMGKGSTFWFKIPCRQAAANPIRRA